MALTDRRRFTESNWRRTRALRQAYWGVVRKLMAWRVVRVRNGHYYSPVPALRHLEDDGERLFDRRRRDLGGIDLREQDQLELLERLAVFHDQQPFGEAPRDELRYFFDNDWFGRADAVFLYSLLRLYRPRRVVEIGSGFSSAVMLDTRRLFLEGEPELTFIEPNAERLRRLLSDEDEATVTVIERRVQDVDPGVVERLDAGDILFVDSSHVLKTGSDVNHILFELLPRLAPGVIVQFHDVLYPFEYPLAWFRQGLSWNEAHALRAFLQYNEAFRVLFWNDFVSTFHRDAVRRLMPLCADPPSYGVGGSLWLRRE